MLKYRSKYSWLANEEIVLLINHYIRNADHRYIVTKRLVFQTTYEKLSEETEKYCSHPYCVKQVKNIVKKCEDELFLNVERMKKEARNDLTIVRKKIKML
jgi:isopentenyldiphosphate isomerase